MTRALHAAKPSLGPARCAAGLALVLAVAIAAAPGTASAGCTAKAPPTPADGKGDLVEELAALGQWMELPRHPRAWRPCGVDDDWRPYFHGSWTWTEEGWFWVSEEPWGWATYHYGRWLFDSAAGWVWLPGKIWAPAWVTWRWSDDVIGWAPLAPGGVLYSAAWTFVPASRFVGGKVDDIAFPAPNVPALLLKTRRSALAVSEGKQGVPLSLPLSPSGGEGKRAPSSGTRSLHAAR